MTKTSKTLVFFGNERLSSGYQPDGAPTLQALIDNGYTVKAVVSHFTPGQSRKARTLEVEEIAKRHNIPVLLPTKVRDIKEQLIEYGAVAGVLIAYGKIIPQDIIDIFPHGIINIHPSLLPLYRGPTPIEQTILHGDHQAGVSLMALVKAMDAGPIYAQDHIPLRGNESKAELTTMLLHKGRNLLIKNLPAILDGSLSPKPQDNSEATYTQLLAKDDGIINLAKPAIQLEREVRAFNGWPKSRTNIYGHSIIVTEVKVTQKLPENKEKLILSCADETYLEILRLIAPSGKTMSDEAFLRGYSS